MSNDIRSRRVPWLALALSFLSAGVGHFYCGRIAKGLPLYFAWLIIPLCCIAAVMGRPSGLGLGLLLIPVAIVLFFYLFAAADAWRIARETGSDYSLRDYNRPWVYSLLIAVQLTFSIAMIFGVRSFVYEPFAIPTRSMKPTILRGDRILSRKLLPAHHFPNRGDLVVYRNPTDKGSTRFIGRVVAVAGDKIKTNDESVTINGTELQRDRVPNEALELLGEQRSGQVAYEENSGHRYLVTYDESVDNAPADVEATVPERHIYVLGDNRDRSRDSREFGSIHVGEVVGYVDYVYWPAESWSRFGLVSD